MVRKLLHVYIVIEPPAKIVVLVTSDFFYFCKFGDLIKMEDPSN